MKNEMFQGLENEISVSQTQSIIWDEPTDSVMKEDLSAWAKELREDFKAQCQQRKTVRLIKVEGKTGTSLLLVAKKDLQDGVALNKILGWASCSVANRSRKWKTLSATWMNRQRGIPAPHEDTDV